MIRYLHLLFFLLCAATATQAAFTDPATGMEMIFIKGGCFQMGDTFGGGNSNERPVHEVCIDDYYLGKFEVTQAQWQKVMGNNPSYFKSGDWYPVESVTWTDAQDFVRKLNLKSGKKYRLPTEAEWEYAARSGGKAEKYAGGNNVDVVAWYGRNSQINTHPVGEKAANGLGLYDMSGNVLEWVSDWYDDRYYANSPRNNPQGPSTGSDRVARGGGWADDLRVVRSAHRLRGAPSGSSYDMGFRLVFPPLR